MVNEHSICVLELYMRMKKSQRQENRIPILPIQIIVIFFANGILIIFAGAFTNECRSYKN